MLATSLAELDVKTIMKLFHNYYMEYDDNGVYVNPEKPDDHDFPETHYFETKQLAEAFLATRCNLFRKQSRSSSSPQIFRCPHNKSCSAYAKWFAAENKIIVNFCHSGHSYSIGQPRFNECQVKLIEFFTIFFWRNERLVTWNLDNICYAMKRWFDISNALAFISPWDMSALGNKICFGHPAPPHPKSFWHYAIYESEKRLTNIPFPPMAEPGTLGFCEYKGFSDSEWTDVDDNIWIARSNADGPVTRVISGKAFHMAKHIFEFACNYLRLGYVVTHDKNILGDWKNVEDLRVAESKFDSFKKDNFNIFEHIEKDGFEFLVTWKRHEMVELNYRAVKKFDERFSIKLHGKFVRGLTAKLPNDYSYPIRSASNRQQVRKLFGNRLQDSSSVLGRYTVSEVLKAMAPAFLGPEKSQMKSNANEANGVSKDNQPRTNSGPCSSTSGNTPSSQPPSVEIVESSKPKTENTRDLEKYDNTMKQLGTSNEKHATIWNSVRVPATGFISSRLYRMTGIPLKQVLQRKIQREEEEKKKEKSNSSSSAVTGRMNIRVHDSDQEEEDYESFDEDGIHVEVLPLHNNSAKNKNKKSKNKKNKNKNKK